MNPFEPGIDDSQDADRRPHALPRVIASLVFAFFAYVGLAFGGGFGAISSTETNSFSAGKSNQPLYQSLRDTARGIVAAERNAEAKNGWHDGKAGLVPPGPSPVSFDPACLPRDHVRAPLAALLAFQAYSARGPPISA